MALYRVRILEAWNGYSAGNTLTVTDKAYYQAKKEGVKMNLVANTNIEKPDPRDEEE